MLAIMLPDGIPHFWIIFHPVDQEVVETLFRLSRVCAALIVFFRIGSVFGMLHVPVDIDVFSVLVPAKDLATSDKSNNTPKGGVLEHVVHLGHEQNSFPGE